MHDLHFLRDALEGGDFCLSLALETLPCKGGLAHLYDIDRREFVIVCVQGKGTEALLLKRHAENDSLLSRAMRKRRAVVVPNAIADDTATLERFLPFGGALSIVTAPVMQAGRFLGALEIVNPLDNAPFNEDEGAAVQYIADQYADFVAQRGVVLDPERIARGATRVRAR
jgi:GAF domain-containing protein